MMTDEQFIQRVYKSSIGWSLLILSYLLISNLLSTAVGFAVGVGVALAGLNSIERVVKVVLTPDGHPVEKKVKMGAFGVVKYGILAIIIALVVKSGWVSLPAFACGIGVPSAIIFLKTLGSYFHEIEFHPFWGHHNHIDPQRVPVRARENRF